MPGVQCVCLILILHSQQTTLIAMVQPQECLAHQSFIPYSTDYPLMDGENLALTRLAQNCTCKSLGILSSARFSPSTLGTETNRQLDLAGNSVQQRQSLLHVGNLQVIFRCLKLMLRCQNLRQKVYALE